jgi:short-subunit dehydrogenase
MELRPWKIPVALVEPAQTDTDIWRAAATMVDQTAAGMSTEHRALYTKHIAGLRKTIPVAQKMAIAPEKVAVAVEEALTARRPRTRYVVGIGPKLQVALMTRLPTPLRDRVLRMVSGQPRRP